MPSLRTVVRLWIGFLVGVSTALALVSLVPPMSSRLMDGTMTAVAFAVGASSAWATDRLVHDPPAAEPVEEQRARHLISA
jgi:hypothetical protein